MEHQKRRIIDVECLTGFLGKGHKPALADCTRSWLQTPSKTLESPQELNGTIDAKHEQLAHEDKMTAGSKIFGCNGTTAVHWVPQQERFGSSE